MTSTISRWARRSTVTALGGVALAVATPLAAQAHVEVTADSTAAGSYAVLSLAVPHGCEGSPTTRLTLAVPAGINEVTPTVDAGWRITKTTEKLAEPLTLDDGDQLTERTSQIVWRARQPLADGFRAVLTVQVQLPADAAGQTLAFPVVQTCEQGHTDWTQVAADGVDAEDLEHPAPSVTVTAATGEDHHHAGGAATDETGEMAGMAGMAGTAETVADVTPQAATTETATGSGAGLGLAGLVAGLLGLAAGLTALVRARRPGPSQD